MDKLLSVAKYLQDLRIIAADTDEHFLIYLIEMAAIEADERVKAQKARLKADPPHC